MEGVLAVWADVDGEASARSALRMKDAVFFSSSTTRIRMAAQACAPKWQGCQCTVRGGGVPDTQPSGTPRESPAKPPVLGANLAPLARIHQKTGTRPHHAEPAKRRTRPARDLVEHEDRPRRATKIAGRRIAQWNRAVPTHRRAASARTGGHGDAREQHDREAV